LLKKLKNTETVILSPSLTVILSGAKNLVVSLRTGSAKNLTFQLAETLRFAQGDTKTGFFNNLLIMTLLRNTLVE